MVQLFKNIKVNWLGKRNLFFAISAAMILAGGISLLTQGSFRLGVDFKGGTIVYVRFQEKPEIEQIRTVLRENGAPNSQIQELRGAGLENNVLIEFESEQTGDDASRGREIITQALNAGFAGKFEILNAESVGPKVGEDLRRQAVLATLYALGGILIYIAFRFEWIYGAAAVFAVFHDALVTLGLFSILDREINLTVIAALLTLVGYSVNDTIVIFDRVRENLKVRRRDDLESILNDSINQTFGRTILTAISTFVAVFALFLFGGEIINNFAFTLVIGTIIGAYSTVAIAAPLVLIYTNARGRAAVRQLAPAKAPRPAKAQR
jgi:preprotein translocase subunit SecF